MKTLIQKDLLSQVFQYKDQLVPVTRFHRKLAQGLKNLVLRSFKHRYNRRYADGDDLQNFYGSVHNIQF